MLHFSQTQVRALSQPGNIKRLTSTAAILLMLMIGCATIASAQLARVGPIDSSNGYPQWYQDKSGLALEFCQNQTQAELNGGWCLLLPADVAGGAPEVFPSNFADEHFFFSADAGDRKAAIPGVNGTTVVLLTSGLEGAFGSGPVKPGDQIVFARVRITVNPIPFDGTYTVYTPYGKFVFDNQVAGDKLFATEDIGLTPGDFTVALNGRIGPFLLPATTPGGAEISPVSASNPTPDSDPAHFGGAFAPTPYPGNGKMYIADPARVGPITGGKADDGTSTYNVTNADGTTRSFTANIFRVEGPNGFAYETTDFSLAGRVYTGPISGDLKVERASYTRDSTGNNIRVDVYASGSAPTQGRIPAGSPPAKVATSMSFFDAACTPTLDAKGNPGPPYSAPSNGGASHQMFSDKGTFYGHSNPATLPTQICVQANGVNSAGQSVPTYVPGQVGDQVFVSEAKFDENTQSLSVKASSSDALTGSVPALTVQGYGTIGSNGQLIASGVLAAPEKVFVLSSARGSNSRQVYAGTVTGGTAAVPVAVNDTLSVAENKSASVSVLANDNGLPAAGSTIPVAVEIGSQGTLGTASVNADGSITYTPNANVFGRDTFTYHVTVGTAPSTSTSNDGTVTVTITQVNQPPVTKDDSIGTLAGSTTSINVLANDSDPDGAADLNQAVIVTGNANLINTLTGAPLQTGDVFPGGVVSFTTDQNLIGGNYSFTYNAVDKATPTPNTSATPATVLVSVSSQETIRPAKTQFTQNKFRWVITGTVTPNSNQTMSITYLDGSYKPAGGTCATPVSAAGTVLDTPVVDSTNTYNWDFILPRTGGVLNPTNTGDNKNGFWCTTPRTILITDTKTGVSTPPQPLQLK